MDDQKKNQIRQMIDKIESCLKNSEDVEKNIKEEVKETKSMAYLKKYGLLDDEK